MVYSRGPQANGHDSGSDLSYETKQCYTPSTGANFQATYGLRDEDFGTGKLKELPGAEAASLW